MAEIIIFGTGDIGQLANHYFEIDSPHDVVAFTVDRAYMEGDSYEGKPLIAFQDLPNRYPPSRYKMFIALSYSSMNKVREEKYNKSKALGYELVSYVSSKCTYMSQIVHGDNCFIFENNTIQPFVRIGNNVTLWSGNHIGHHSVIDDHNFISSHVVVSGHCRIKSHCFIGVNATLHNDVVIEQENLIAAGAIITKSTEKKDVILPARSTLIGKKSDELEF
jgi:sugar O-acyltransferase (sialic acid O-acetyltransferase NeuD family)